MRRRFRWGDVQADVEKLSAPKIERLYRHCTKLLSGMPDDAALIRLRIHAYTYFCMFSLAFKLEFDVDNAEWVLNFARDPRRPTRRPLPALMRRVRRCVGVPKRARRARRRRKASLKRIVFYCRYWCGRTADAAVSKLSPLFARTVVLMHGIEDVVQRGRWRRSFAALHPRAWISNSAPPACDTGARLELQLFGESLGLPLWLNTFAPVAPFIDWDAALFGERCEESERMPA